ncbi:MAG: hypothetical protein QM486_04800 [Flavobacteriaceae bacterium]
MLRKLNPIYFISILVGFLLLLLVALPKKSVVIKTPKGKSITFILGTDKHPDNPFYRYAENYYRFNAKDKTELVVTTCRSLVEVHNYLIRHKPKNKVPWRCINLVSHGNQYLGLSVKVTPKSKRASAQEIWKYCNNGTLKKLPEDVINQQTIIALHGCGLGNNKDLLTAVKSAFSTHLAMPKIEASAYFEYYVAKPYNMQKVTRFLAKSYNINFKMGYKPSNKIIERRFKTKYKNDSVDWHAALSRKQASKIGAVFYMSFNVPVKWIFTYDGMKDVPNLDTKSDRLNWVKQNAKIINDLQKIAISPQQFNWWMRRVYIKEKDDTKVAALWVKGYSTSFNILKIVK